MAADYTRLKFYGLRQSSVSVQLKTYMAGPTVPATF